MVSANLLVVGEGLLADLFCKELSSEFLIVRKTHVDSVVPETIDLAMVLHNEWNPSIDQIAEDVYRASNTPWLRGCVSFGEGIVGPLVYPEIPGCSQCADLRRIITGRHRREMWQMHKNLENTGKSQHEAWISRTGLLQMVYLLKTEIQRFIKENHSQAEKRIGFINLKTLKSSWHSFLPVPQCKVCSSIPDDSPELARISLQQSPKISMESYRTRSLDDLKNVLVKDYLDSRTGLLNDKMFNLVPPFADVSVNLPLFEGDEGTAGRTNSYAQSELTAILEGLERYCGLEPRGKRTKVYDSYENVKDQALNPQSVGVHETEQYQRPGFPFEKFDPDRPMKWVWGFSLLIEQPILIPELLAYYSLGCGSRGFVYETSNGCALGGSLEEAIFYGIMEVVERDSFLMTWYAKLSLPRIDPYSSEDEELKLMIERMSTVGGYDLYVYNSTMEHGIPSIVALAKNKKQKGLNLICAAGAHLDPVRAVKTAVHELAGMMWTLDEKLEANKEEYVRMLQDSSLVQQMDDHGMLYGLPEAEERLHFLLNNNSPIKAFNEAFKWKSNHADLTEDLQDILQALRSVNLDVIVVDQTTPELKQNRLHCVKVLIPGMVPMTFGHHLKRVSGLERVLRVPMELGYTTEPLTYEKLNPLPHPFP